MRMEALAPGMVLSVYSSFPCNWNNIISDPVHFLYLYVDPFIQHNSLKTYPCCGYQFALLSIWLLSGIILGGYITICWFSHLLIDIWIVSSFLQLCLKLLLTSIGIQIIVRDMLSWEDIPRRGALDRMIGLQLAHFLRTHQIPLQ